MVTSGIRLGAPAATSRGFGVAEFKKIGELIAKTLDGLAANGEAGNAAVEAKVASEHVLTSLTASLPDLREAESAQCAALIAAVSKRR